jgi:hypothetical protein
MISKNVANGWRTVQGDESAGTGKVVRERWKEITCLYESRDRMGQELPLEHVCQRFLTI